MIFLLILDIIVILVLLHFKIGKKIDNKNAKHVVNISKILLITLLLELTVFNVNSYRLLFGNYDKKSYNASKIDRGYIAYEMNNIDAEIATITLDIESERPVRYKVFYTDDTSAYYRDLPEKKYVPDVKNSNAIPCFLSGKTKNLKIELYTDGEEVKFNKVDLNEPIEFNFSINRFVILSIVLIFIYGFMKFEFFNKEYSEKNWKQFAIIMFIFISFLGLQYFCTSTSRRGELLDEKTYTNLYLDAIMDGQLNLKEKPIDSLLELDNPYDYTERTSKGIFQLFDVALYKDNYYVYFGILPVVTLLLPFKLITNEYMKTDLVVFIYSALASFFMLKILLAIYKRWFKNLTFKVLVLNIIIMFFGSLLLWICRRPHMYEIASVSGLYFVLQGVFFMFKATEQDKPNYIYLVLSCLSMALSVACRPTMLIASLVFVPMLIQMLVKNIKEKKDIPKLVLGVRNTIFGSWYMLNDIKLCKI